MASIEVPKGEVTKVATNVTAGFIYNLTPDIQMMGISVDTGDTAPTADEIADEAHLVFYSDKIEEEVIDEDGVDIYLFSPYKDGKVSVKVQ